MWRQRAAGNSPEGKLERNPTGSFKVYRQGFRRRELHRVLKHLCHEPFGVLSVCNMILGTGGDRINKPSELVLPFRVADFLVERDAGHNLC